MKFLRIPSSINVVFSVGVPSSSAIEEHNAPGIVPSSVNVKLDEATCLFYSSLNFERFLCLFSLFNAEKKVFNNDTVAV